MNAIREPRAIDSDSQFGSKIRHALWFIAALSIFAAHVPTILFKKFANVDEAYAGAIAQRLLDGKVLYVGAVSQRGPLMYYAFEAIAKFFGWDNIGALRVCALAFSFAQFALVYWAGRTLFSIDIGILAAIIVAYAISFGFPPYDGLALNGETLLLPVFIVGLVLAALSIRQPEGALKRKILLSVSGLALGAASCTKQTAFPHAFVVALFVFVRALNTRKAAIKGGLDACVHLGSFSIVPIFFLLDAYRYQAIEQFIYYFITYNVNIYSRPVNQESLLFRCFERIPDYPLFFTGASIIIWRMVADWWPKGRLVVRSRSLAPLAERLGIDDFFRIQFLVALAVAAHSPQLFQHYFLVPLPMMAICLGIEAKSWIERWTKPRILHLTIAIASTLWAVSLLVILRVRVRREGRLHHDAAVEKVAQFIERGTRPEDKIFVWGFSPWLYGYSHRAPAGRYVFSTYVTGFIPWFWDGLDREKENIVPGSVDALLSDLDDEKPEIVVDAGSVFMARSMRAYERPAEWLHANYCFENRMGSFDMYRRKKMGIPCVINVFPVLAPVVDYNSETLSVRAPLPVDLDKNGGGEDSTGDYVFRR